MTAMSKSLMTHTAEDLMTHCVVRLPEDMSLRDAARLLLRNQVGGAPVVDARGRCVGVLSATDFLRMAELREDASRPTSPPLPLTCGFQAKYRGPDGKEATRCTLPAGVCPLQMKKAEPGGGEVVICTQPHCVLSDWQVVNLETLPRDAVRQFMTADPVTVPPDMDIRSLARMMIDAHIHRIIVVDEERKPIGIVTSTDVLAAMAYSEDEMPEGGE